MKSVCVLILLFVSCVVAKAQQYEGTLTVDQFLEYPMGFQPEYKTVKRKLKKKFKKRTVLTDNFHLKGRPDTIHIMEDKLVAVQFFQHGDEKIYFKTDCYDKKVTLRNTIKVGMSVDDLYGLIYDLPFADDKGVITIVNSTNTAWCEFFTEKKRVTRILVETYVESI